jgi:hypothetical protein
MAYLLQNLSTMQTATCDDEMWLRYLSTARENGWEREGTRYDLNYQIDETFDSLNGRQYNLWMILILAREMFEWDGNYVDKSNQTVSESDAYSLMQSLAKTWAGDDRSFLDFLESGAFRICAS